ncbi:MAG: putative amidohydrolase YtcJ [Gammaproteobacteria bacterium]|jgi:predicted amidohydrolase YtcJ
MSILLKKITAFCFLSFLFTSNFVIAQSPLLIKYADVVLFNGQVITVDQASTVTEAIAVRDGRILALGNTNDMLALAGPDTMKIDLRGRSVTPGYIYNDGDNSVPGGDIYKDTMVKGWLSGRIEGASLDTLLSSLNKLTEESDKDEPIFVNMPKASPRVAEEWTADDLDEVSPDNPMALFYNDSVVVVNHAMLDIAIKAGLPTNAFGVVLDDSGIPTGQLFQQAAGFVGWQVRPWPSPEYIDNALEETVASLRGYTSVGATTATGHMSGLTISMLNELFHDDKLLIRVYPGHDFTRQNPFAEQYLKRVGNLVDFSLSDPVQGPMVKIVGAATGPVDDGSNSQFGMLTIEPKENIDFEIGGTELGLNKWTGEVWTGLTWADMTDELKAQTDYNTITLLQQYGWNMSGNHNMGSQALRTNLLAIDKFYKSGVTPYFESQKINAFDHNLVWHESNYPILDEYKDKVAMALTTEIFDQRTSITGRKLLESQYGDRMHSMQPVKTLLDRGYMLHIEGTGPSNHPMWMIERFVTRTDDEGKVWGADQAINRLTALRMLTWNAARFIGEEDSIGSLEAGKWADIAVLNGDFMDVADTDIDSLKIDMTFVGGKLVFDSRLFE